MTGVQVRPTSPVADPIGIPRLGEPIISRLYYGKVINICIPCKNCSDGRVGGGPRAAAALHSAGAAGALRIRSRSGDRKDGDGGDKGKFGEHFV